jgi:hypothetical protein
MTQANEKHSIPNVPSPAADVADAAKAVKVVANALTDEGSIDHLVDGLGGVVKTYAVADVLRFTAKAGIGGALALGFFTGGCAIYKAMFAKAPAAV